VSFEDQTGGNFQFLQLNLFYCLRLPGQGLAYAGPPLSFRDWYPDADTGDHSSLFRSEGRAE
jgi:hypothetical protein